MNKHILIIFTLFVALLSSCKQDDWLDWKAQNELWLLENAKRDSVVTSPTGLQYKCIHRGPNTGYPIKPDDTKMVTISYQGWLINGYCFDTQDSYPSYITTFTLGFQEGLKRMQFGDIYEFYIPYYLGYKSSGNQVAEGNSSHIPPYSTLIFRVQLLGVN